MRTTQISIVAALAAIFISSCGGRVNDRKTLAWEEMTTEQRFEAMRSDMEYITMLDSSARIHIGINAGCLDPVRHLFECDGRRWLFSDDWGGLIELPVGWMPEEDVIQTEFTFHGTHVWSPDSLMLIQTYSGFRNLETLEEFEEEIRDRMEECGITVSSWLNGEVIFTPERTSPVITVTGRNADGINFYGRYIFFDQFFVEHRASVQWNDADSASAHELIGFIYRFPFGPEGQVPEGDAAALAE